MKKFMEHVIFHCDFLKARFQHKVEEAYTTWQTYRMKVPTCGAIILNKDCSKV